MLFPIGHLTDSILGVEAVRESWDILWSLACWSYLTSVPLSRVAQAVTLLARILEVPSSNLVRDTNYPTEDFRCNPLLHPDEHWDSTLKQTTQSLPSVSP